MIKKVIINLFLVFLVASILTGCSIKKHGLLDFEEYKDIDIDNIDKIDVEWDINENEPINFSIVDQTKIDEITGILCNEDTFTRKKSDIDSNHSSITLIDSNNNKTKISLSKIKNNNKIYYYANSDLYNYIYSIGVELNKLT